MQDSVNRPKDTTLYRIQKGVGFNARVEPMWYTYQRLEERMGFFEKWREKRRMKRLIGGINEALAKGGTSPDSWDVRDGECICNLRVAKVGLLAELRAFIGSKVDPEVSKTWTHLLGHRDRNSLLLPIDFPAALQIVPSGGEETIPVGSAPRVAAELREANELLKIDETFALAKVKKFDYLDATERDISIYESRFGTFEGFWAKFAYILLKKLADKSVEKGLPVIFA